MKICFFGTYEKDYPSNRIIIKGLRKNGADGAECRNRRNVCENFGERRRELED